MAKAKKSLLNELPIISPKHTTFRNSSFEPSLLVQRMRELDREFARQTKQLTKITKDFAKKLTNKLEKK